MTEHERHAVIPADVADQIAHPPVITPPAVVVDRRAWRVFAVACVLIGFAAALLYVRQDKQAARIDEQNQQISDLVVARDRLGADVGSLRAQLTAAGQTPVAPPADETIAASVGQQPGPAGPKGDAGPGPTDTQVQTAVALWLFQHPPQAGRPPTAEEITSAVAAWCGGHGGCAGRDGANGQDGASASAAQIAAAVVDYCGERGNCAGPAGATGVDGPPGPPGQMGAQGPPVGSFTFSLGANRWLCRDDDGDTMYDCQRV